MKPGLGRFVIGVLLLLLLTSSATQVSAEDFYHGKTIRFVVGFSAGGGFDTYTRTIARHIGKHVPGAPNTIVENMPGAGSLISANYIYNRAAPDGLTVGHWIGGLIQQQLLGTKGIHFDARKFEWLGVPLSDNLACAMTKRSGITSVERWYAAKEPVKVGAEAPGAGTANIPRIIKAALNLPIQLVEGYKGTSDIRLAAEAGEVAGGCWSWESIKPTWRKGIEAGDVVIVIQANPQRHRDLLNVPNAIEVAKTQEGRELIRKGLHDLSAVTRPYMLPPGSPRDRVELLQKAFMETMKDPAFLADAKKSNLDINPRSGEEIAKIVTGIFEIDATLLAKLRETLVPKT
jgi:tripartite-type tricarboxylate transporter receptor subunit TctC